VFVAADARTQDLAAGGQKWSDPRLSDALPDAYIAMGQNAENVAQITGVSGEGMYQAKQSL
jgi:acetyl-CoA C-acetyltransferase